MGIIARIVAGSVGSHIGRSIGRRVGSIFGKRGRKIGKGLGGLVGEHYAYNLPILGSFQRGGYVKKTGAYILHKGEHVVPNKRRKRK